MTEAAAGRRRRAGAVGVLAAFVLVAGVVAATARGRNGDDVAAPAMPRTGERGWAAILPAPIKGRFNHQAVWTGAEMVILGGDPSSHATDAGAYDPAAGTWRVLATPPVDLALGLSVWTGVDLLALAPDGSLHAYDPDADRWEERAHSPWRGFQTIVAGNVAGVWTGSEFVVIRSRTLGDDQPAGPSAAYDPAADSWRDLPSAPVNLYPFGLVWTGAATHQILVSGVVSHGLFDPPRYSIWSFDTTTDTWTQLPMPPLEGFVRRRSYFTAWTGTEYLVGGGFGQTAAGEELYFRLLAENGGRSDLLTPEQQAAAGYTEFRDAAAFDPATGTWRVVAGAPVEIAVMNAPGGTWTGTEVLLWEARPSGSTTTGRPVLYDPGTDTWRVEPAGPQGERQHAPTAWTGNELLWWSGEASVGDSAPAVCCWPDNGGMAFTP